MKKISFNKIERLDILKLLLRENKNKKGIRKFFTFYFLTFMVVYIFMTFTV